MKNAKSGVEIKSVFSMLVSKMHGLAHIFQDSLADYDHLYFKLRSLYMTV